MSRLNVANFRHPDATADSVVITSGGDTQIQRALGLGGATYGTSGQVLTSAGSGAAPTWENAANLTRGTAATLSASGAIFDSLPSGIRRITMTLWDVSMDVSSDFAVRIGDSGGIESSDYVSWNKRFGGSAFSTAGGTTQTGFLVGSDANSNSNFFGHVVLTNITGNDWVCTSWLADQSDNFRWQIGKKSLSAELDRIQIDVLSTNNLDNGTVNIFYEV